MSYIRADRILPRELLETIQRYVEGQSIYIPCRGKREWGSGTSARAFFRERDEDIYAAYCRGASPAELSRRFSLSEKSIQRIVRAQRKAASADDEGA